MSGQALREVDTFFSIDFLWKIVICERKSALERVLDFKHRIWLEDSRDILMRQLLNRTGVFQSDYRRLINSGNGKLRRHTEISGDYSIIIAFSLKN